MLLVRLTVFSSLIDLTKDLYASQLKFRIHSRTLSGKDFLLNIPTASRKAYGEDFVGARRFADIQGLLCHDSYQRPVFSIFVFHLAPHESLDITITNGRAGQPRIGENAAAALTRSDADPRRDRLAHSQ